MGNAWTVHQCIRSDFSAFCSCKAYGPPLPSSLPVYLSLAPLSPSLPLLLVSLLCSPLYLPGVLNVDFSCSELVWRQPAYYRHFSRYGVERGEGKGKGKEEEESGKDVNQNHRGLSEPDRCGGGILHASSDCNVTLKDSSTVDHPSCHDNCHLSPCCILARKERKRKNRKKKERISNINLKKNLS